MKKILMLAKQLALANLSVNQNETEAHNGSRLALNWPLSLDKILSFGPCMKNVGSKYNSVERSEISTQIVLRIENSTNKIKF